MVATSSLAGLGGESELTNPTRLRVLEAEVGEENVTTIEEAGHNVHLGQPAAVVRELKHILDRWIARQART